MTGGGGDPGAARVLGPDAAGRPGRDLAQPGEGGSSSRAGAPSCAHCGLQVPAGLVRDGDARQFCCGGCRQVYTLVHEWGFDQYYRLAGQQRGSLEPARVSGRTFEDFDDPRAQAEASGEAGGDRRRTRLYLEGVHCAACVWLVEKLPAVLRGVDEVRLNAGTGIAEVTWRPAHTRFSAIARALDRLGYTPHLHRASREQEARRAEDRAGLARLGVAAACAMNLMFLHGAIYAGEYSGMASPYQTLFRWLSLVVALPVLLYSARPFFTTALAGLRTRMVHIDLPIAIALAAAFTASGWNTLRGSGPLWFDSLAMLVAALLGARQLQRSAQRAALERADSLRGVAFLEFARRLEGGGASPPVVEVPLAALAPGDRVEVRSGELVPADGVVVSGRSSLDNAVVTGESTALPVVEGERVFAGATNLGARLVVRVDAAGGATRVGALLAIVQEALSQKPALLQATDRLARRFVQAVLALTVLSGALWIRQGPEVAFERMVALLVVACPCALGLSVPLALSVALMRAARAGIFVKDPDALERLRRPGTVLLDKTGTLTEGRPSVARWHGDQAALDLARALEAGSAHAVARAFRSPVGRPVRLVRTVSEVVETPGHGIAGRLDGHEVRVGNRAHVEAGGARLPTHLEAFESAIVADLLTPVFVSVDGTVEGVAGIGDRLRPDARTTIAALRARGARVRILSGDHPDLVRRIGWELGLPEEDALGGLTPEAKQEIVAALTAHRGDRAAAREQGPDDVGGSEGPAEAGRHEVNAERANDVTAGARADAARADDVTAGARADARAAAREQGPDDVGGSEGPAEAGRHDRRAVVMVGDGVNDAAALARADVGIAVHGGTGAAIVAADIVLTREGVAPLADILDGARRLRGVVGRNLGFSLAYNAAACSLALAGLVTPLAAAILMPCSSLVVVLASAFTPTFPARGARPAVSTGLDRRAGTETAWRAGGIEASECAAGAGAPGAPAGREA